MNLTLKQLFKFGVVCVTACALNASATDYLSDSFEDGTVGQSIISYGVTVDQVTNWVADATDASTIVYTNAAYANISGDGPIAGTSELMLDLDTEGKILSRAVTNDLDIATPVYIDTLVQFAISDDEPTIDTTGIKVAMYVNAQSNLVVVHNMYDPPSGAYPQVETNSIISGVMDPAEWYRLTIKVYYDGVDTFALIYTNGTLITHANAFDFDNDVNGGDHFLSLIPQDNDIDSIGFQGTGSLDELVVSDTNPWGSTVVISLVFAGASGTFTAGGSGVTEVDSGTEVVMTAAEWYRITSVDGPIDETITGLPLGTVTTTVTSDSDCTVTATVAGVSGEFDNGNVVVSNSATLATWATTGQTLAEGDIIQSDLDDYLLNVVRGTDATIAITSIEVDAVADTTTIEVDASDSLVDFTVLNGALDVDTTDDLGTGFTETAKVVGEATTASDATLTITGVADEFIKAVVKDQ